MSSLMSLVERDELMNLGSRRKFRGAITGSRTRTRLIAFCYFVMSVTACTTTPQLSTEEVVGNLAGEWAEALMALDYDKALAMTTPGFQKSPRASRYRADFSGTGWWQDVTLKSVECDDITPSERCEVRQIISLMRPPATKYPIPIPYDTVWLNIDGEWYIFHD